ncbi:MAG: tetratricopeptide repeat protein, partial [Chloroflexi bacterium]|nr:tetratricopeptide repeat protein [Chloroflexota bacterium]
MQCLNCGATAQGRYEFCPTCGASLKQQRGRGARRALDADLANADTPVEADSSLERTFAPPLQRKRGLPRYLGVVLFMLFWLCAVLIGFGSFGAWQGLQDRDQTALASSADHKAKAKAYLQQGNIELAIAELTEARRLNPTDPEIAALIATLQTPGAPSAKTTPTSAPTVAVIASEDITKTYANGKQAFETKDYELAEPLLESVRRSDANYHRSELEDMLYTTDVALAHLYLDEKRWEEAVQKFDRALAIRKSERLQTERNLAVAYQRGLTSRGADWKRAIDAFAEVVRTDAKYLDAYEQLYSARIGYGDSLLARNLPCQAADQYAAAIIMGVTSQLQAKQTEASTACLALAQGTSTPTAKVTVTPTITVTHTVAPPSGAKYTV